MKILKNNFIKVSRYILHKVLFDGLVFISGIFPNSSHFNYVRGLLLKPFFRKAGKNFQIAKGAIINSPQGLEIGDNVYIAHNVWINATGGIEIGDNVIISPGCVLASTKHHFDIKAGVSHDKSSNERIVIGSGTWIASNSTITMKASIGKNVLVGAGSTVINEVPSNTFVSGVPAKEVNR